MNYKYFLNFLLIVTLISCGGGGGSGSSDPEPPSIFNPVINTFTSSSSSITSGNSIDLSWTTTNAISCSGSGDWDGVKATGSGSETLTLTDIKTYTFTLTCIGESSQNTVSKSVTVEVTESNGSSTNIYSEDKASYCATPSNDSSSYWLEDFSSNILDENIFTYQESNGFCAIPGCPNGDSDYVNGWGNNELQYYTSCREGFSKACNIDTNTTENAFIENGYLKIQPIFNNKEPFNDPYCQSNYCNWSGTWDYTSARIMTSGKKIISPGTEITVCFKHPEGMGHWPAIWMLPQGFIEGDKSWPRDGENDLVEHMSNHQSFETQSTIHFGSNSPTNIWKIETVPADVDFFDKFHSVTMKWQVDKIEYFLDTQQDPYFTITKNRPEFNNNHWPFNNNFYLLINVASGGNGGGFPDSSKFCQDTICSNLPDKDRGRLLIDYIEIKSID